VLFIAGELVGLVVVFDLAFAQGKDFLSTGFAGFLENLFVHENPEGRVVYKCFDPEIPSAYKSEISAEGGAN
jgi:hypothetical protein